MKWLWGTMLSVGIVFNLLQGTPANAIDSMLSGAQDAVVLCINLAGAYMLWMGLLGIAKKAGLIDSLAKRLERVLRRLFPGERDALAPITLNVAANLLGMGNAATPFGLHAMKELNRFNKMPRRATNNMVMFLSINAAAIQLVPTTVLSLRTAAGSADASAIIVPTFIASLITFTSAILLCKLLEKRFS